MTTFRDLYCAKRHCDPDRFAGQLLWRCLPWRTRLLAIVLGGTRAKYFQPDRDLIAAVASVTNRPQIAAQVTAFLNARANRTWMRSELRLRMSTGRLEAIARRHLTRTEPKIIELPRVPGAPHPNPH